jgi:hypothetical protein
MGLKTNKGRAINNRQINTISYLSSISLEMNPYKMNFIFAEVLLSGCLDVHSEDIPERFRGQAQKRVEKVLCVTCFYVKHFAIHFKIKARKVHFEFCTLNFEFQNLSPPGLPFVI